MQQADVSIFFAFAIGVIVLVGSVVRIFSVKKERKIYFITLLFSVVVLVFGILKMKW